MNKHKIKIKREGHREYGIYVDNNYIGRVEINPNVITAYYTEIIDGEPHIKHTMTDDFDVATSIVVGKYIKNINKKAVSPM